MRFATRLDTVVRVREVDEDKARQKLVTATRAVRTAEAEVDRARETAHTDGRLKGDASLWDMADSANTMARAALGRAEVQLVQAQNVHATARGTHARAWQSAEAMRRAAETRRDELILESGRKDRRDEDEVGRVLHVLKK